MRTKFLLSVAVGIAFNLTASLSAFATVTDGELRDGFLKSPRPNILWLIAEDFGRHLGCFGTKEVWMPTAPSR